MFRMGEGRPWQVFLMKFDCLCGRKIVQETDTFKLFSILRNRKRNRNSAPGSRLVLLVPSLAGWSVHTMGTWL